MADHFVQIWRDSETAQGVQEAIDIHAVERFLPVQRDHGYPNITLRLCCLDPPAGNVDRIIRAASTSEAKL